VPIVLPEESVQRTATERRWDGYDAYLFDIDGTLLNCTDAVHYFAFCETLTKLAGKPMNLDGVVAHGNTDVGIMRDAFELAGVQDGDWRPRLGEARDAMCAFVEREKLGICAEPLPYVNEVLRHLAARGAALGVATGNLEGIGRIKLQHCGLLEHFQFGGYSDQFEYRTDVFRAALGKARAIAGEAARVCAVGDTPLDILAAKENGIDVIAVATGIYSIEELAAEDPTFCVSSMKALMEVRQS
jgi:phosphoglycolate phosphatase